jgi:hypothetical protein
MVRSAKGEACYKKIRLALRIIRIITLLASVENNRISSQKPVYIYQKMIIHC